MDMNALAIDVKMWADVTFPNRTDASMFLKLYGEIAEMIEADDSHVGDEIADVFIMLLDFCKRKGLNPSVIVQRKMNVNRKREWIQNKLGAFSHVKDASRVPGQPGTGNNHAAGGSQALAHDRHDTPTNACRTHGQCRAVELDDCANFPGRVLRCREHFAECDGPRSGRGLPRGRADTQQIVDWARSDQSGGEDGVAVFVSHRGRTRFEGIIPIKTV